VTARSHFPAGAGLRRHALTARGPIAALLVAMALAAGPAQAAADVTPRVSLLAIERQAMCVTCKVALDESEAPQANTEREYIQSLINRGEDEGEIKRALVAQYGPTVLGLPSAHGFDLAAYLVPVLVVLGLVATVLALIPSWRRRARAQSAAASSSAALSPDDAAKLDADLARFD
jgi:cytochrome c-type biogenesis protein CcmH/NrfF